MKTSHVRWDNLAHSFPKGSKARLPPAFIDANQFQRSNFVAMPVQHRRPSRVEIERE
jgi:hypothetical protein